MKVKFILIIAFILSLNLSGQNNAPQFTSIPDTIIYESIHYSYLLTAYDADGDSIEFLFVDFPQWLSLFEISIDSVYISGYPDENFYTMPVKIGITDEIDTTYQIFNIYLYCSSCGISIYPQPIDTAYVNYNYEYNIYAGVCEPGSEILFECDTLPAWLNLENTGLSTAVLSGIPTINDLGTFEIIIKVYIPNDPCLNDTWLIFDLKILDQITSVDKNFINNLKVYPVPCKDRLYIQPGNKSSKNYIKTV